MNIPQQRFEAIAGHNFGYSCLIVDGLRLLPVRIHCWEIDDTHDEEYAEQRSNFLRRGFFSRAVRVPPKCIGFLCLMEHLGSVQIGLISDQLSCFLRDHQGEIAKKRAIIRGY